MDIIALGTPEGTEQYAAPDGCAREPFFVSLCGRTERGTPCYQLRLSSGVYTLQYVLYGSGVLICDEKIYTVKTGDAFLLPVGADQIYYSHPEESFSRLWINFTGSLAASLLRDYGIERRVVFRGAAIEREMQALFDTCRSERDAVRYAMHTARHFLAAVQGLAVTPAGGEDAPDAVERIRLYIDTHFTENLHIGQIAENVGFSKEYLIRLFKKTYGITPHSYILQSKLRVAMVLLTTTDKTLEEIAASLSFSDPRHFSAQFLRYVGERPSRYRQRYQRK